MKHEADEAPQAVGRPPIWAAVRAVQRSWEAQRSLSLPLVASHMHHKGSARAERASRAPRRATRFVPSQMAFVVLSAAADALSPPPMCGAAPRLVDDGAFLVYEGVSLELSLPASSSFVAAARASLSGVGRNLSRSALGEALGDDAHCRRVCAAVGGCTLCSGSLALSMRVLGDGRARLLRARLVGVC